MITVNKANPTPGEITSSLTGSTGDGAGLHFDGAAGHVEATALSFSDLTKYSFEVVFSTEDATTSCVLIGNSNSSTTRKVLGFKDGILRLGYKEGSWAAVSGGTIEANTVYHVVATRDGTTQKIYINGNEVTSGTLDSIYFGTTAALRLAYSGDSTDKQHFTGTIYRARVYNHTLSADDVRTAYERADVDFSLQYGSQTNLVSGYNFTSGYSAYGTGAVVDSNTYTTGGAGSGIQKSLLTVGKKYRVTVAGSSSAGDFQIQAYGTWAVLATGFGTHEFTASTAAIALTATASSTVDVTSFSITAIGVVTDLDLAFASPTQSLTVQDRSGAADGTCSASGVTQVQPVVQLNSTSARIGTSAATPADGEVLANKLKVGDTHGEVTLNNTSGTSGSTVLSQTYNGGVAELRIGSNISTASTSAMNVITGDAGDVKFNGQVGIKKTAGHALDIDGDVNIDANHKLRWGGGNAEIIGDGSYNLDFKTYDGSATTTKLTINSTGNVGIGDSPSTLLHLKSANPVIRLEDSDPDGVYAEVDGAGGDLILSADGGNGDADSQIKFKVDNSIKATIDSTGHVAIGDDKYYQWGGTNARIVGSHSGNYVKILTGNSAKLTVDSTGLATFSAGINLGDTTLSNYKEGSFTPTIGAETGTINGTNIVGRYTRIGNVCHVWFSIECTGVSGASGAVEFGNFPFTSSSIASGFNTPMVVRYVSLGSAVESLVLRMFNDSSGGRIEEQNGTSVTNLADNVQNGTIFQVAGSYRV
jgi:hypothetical protein